MPSEKTIQFTDKSGNYLYPKIRTANVINDGHFLQVSDSGYQGYVLIWTAYGPKWQPVGSDSPVIRYRSFTSSDVHDGKVSFTGVNAPVGVETSQGNYYPVQKLSVELGVSGISIILDPYLVYQGTPSVTGTWRVWFAGGSQQLPPDLSVGTITMLQQSDSASGSFVATGLNQYVLNLSLPRGKTGKDGSDGVTPVLHGGTVTTLPAGSSVSASLVESDSNVYTLNLSIPRGDTGFLQQIQEYDASQSYSALDCVSYMGSSYQVLSAVYAGENPDNTPAKFLCIAAKGADGSDAHLQNSYQVVSSLTAGKIVVQNSTFPVALKTNLGSVYPLEKGSVTSFNDAWWIDPTPYLVYDDAPSFTGPWTVYFAGGLSIQLSDSETGTLNIKVGHDKQFTTLQSAVDYAVAVNPARAIVVLDPFQSDGVTPAVYQALDHAVIWPFQLKIRGPQQNLQTKPIISGHLIASQQGRLELENVQIRGRITASLNSTVYIGQCIVDDSAATSSQDIIKASRGAYICVSNTDLIGNTSYVIGITAQLGACVDVTGYSSLTNTRIALYTRYGSYIDAKQANLPITNATSEASPAINTVGNVNSYIHR